MVTKNTYTMVAKSNNYYNSPVRLMERKRKGGRIALYLMIYKDGIRKDEYLNLYLEPGRDRDTRDRNRDTMREAEAICAKRLIEFEKGSWDSVITRKDTVFFVDYMRRVAERNTKENTRSSWASAIKKFVQYTNGRNVKMRDMTARLMYDYKYWLTMTCTCDRKKDVTRISVNSAAVYYSKVVCAIRSAIRDGLIVENLILRIPHLRSKEVEKCYLSIDDLRRLLSAPLVQSVPLKKAFLFSCFTGLRYSDVKALTWRQVFYDGGHTKIEFRQKKTGIPMRVSISDNAVSLMGDRGADDAPVFPLKSCASISRVLRRWACSVGVDKPITFHSGRHTFATMLITLGNDIYTVSKLLGHANVEMSQHYARMVDERKDVAVASIPKLI